MDQSALIGIMADRVVCKYVHISYLVRARGERPILCIKLFTRIAHNHETPRWLLYDVSYEYVL